MKRIFDDMESDGTAAGSKKGFWGRKSSSRKIDDEFDDELDDEFDDDEEYDDDDEYDDDEFDDDEEYDDEEANAEYDAEYDKEYDKLEEEPEPAEVNSVLEDDVEDEYEDDAFEDASEDDEFEDDDEEEAVAARRVVAAKGRKPQSRKGFGTKVKGFFGRFGLMEGVAAVTGLVIIVVAAVLFSRYQALKDGQAEVQTLASLGSHLVSVQSIGAEGLASIQAAADQRLQEELLQQENPVEEEEEEGTLISATLNYTSIEKDFKIKFVNKRTGKLIPSVKFSIDVTNPAGKTTTYTDDDMDGIIYQSGLAGGNYTVKVSATEECEFDKSEYTIAVKGAIEYVKVDVSDEIKNEQDVNVSKEDTAQEVEQEEVLTDTVEWVDSNKVAVGNTDGYAQVDKSTLVDPGLVGTTARAGGYAGYLLLAEPIGMNTTSLLTEGNQGETSPAPTTPTPTPEVSPSTSPTTPVTPSGPVVSPDPSQPVVSPSPSPTIDQVTVKLISGTAILNEGNKATLQATVTVLETVANTVSRNVTWKSDNEAAATVDSNGIVTAGKVTKDTEVTITATTEGKKADGTFATATYKITVKAPVIAPYVTKLELDKTTATMIIGTTAAPQTLTLLATVTYNDDDNDAATPAPTKTSATAGVVTWTSSVPTVAKVDPATGVITSLKAGTTKITATTVDLNNAATPVRLMAECTITVTNGTLALTMPSTQNIYVGTTAFVPATITLNGVTVITDGKDATKGHVTWISSNTSIATVNSETGLITPIKAGSFVLQATSVEKDAAGNHIVASCTVTVKNDPKLDTTTLLLDKSGRQVYVNKNNVYVAATWADYYTADKFYVTAGVQYKYTGWQTIDGKTYFYDKNGNPVKGEQVIQGVKYNFTNEGILNLGNAIRGIDVSRWNGDIDWNKVKDSGVSYVIIRCGYRGSSAGALIEDWNYKKNIQGAINAGLKVGVYFFSQAITEAEAVEEASMVLGLVKNYKISYPIFIDTEPSGGRADSLTKAQRTAVCNAFCQTIKNAGYSAGIYASKSWFNSKLTVSSLSAYKIWVAQYASTCTYTGRYDLWQYSAKGSISGIGGDVDLNYSYMGY